MMRWDDTNGKGLSSVYVETVQEPVYMSEIFTRLNRLRVYTKTSVTTQTGTHEIKSDILTVYHNQFTMWPDYGVPTGLARVAILHTVRTIHLLRLKLGFCGFWTHW